MNRFFFTRSIFLWVNELLFIVNKKNWMIFSHIYTIFESFFMLHQMNSAFEMLNILTLFNNEARDLFKLGNSIILNWILHIKSCFIPTNLILTRNIISLSRTPLIYCVHLSTTNINRMYCFMTFSSWIKNSSSWWILIMKLNIITRKH